MAKTGLTRYGMQIGFTATDGTLKTTTKSYNGFNVSSEAEAANQFAQFVKGGGSISDSEETNPGLLGVLSESYQFSGTLNLTRTNAIEGSDS